MPFRKKKAKKWVKRILKENCENIVVPNSENYLHETDKKALDALKKIPLFDKLCSKFISVFNESIANMEDISSKIRVSEQQIPRIYHMVVNIVKKLGIEMPNLYIDLNREPNAYTYGNETATITITSGLLECLDDDEIYAVLAHECGHIACKHMLYHTMGQFILNDGFLGRSILDNNGFFDTAITAPLKIAFYNWMRCSEFSADRAAIICCKGVKPVIQTMMRLAGGTTHIGAEVNEELFVEQAIEYKEMLVENKSNKESGFFIIHNQKHPLMSVRAYEAIQWIWTKKYSEILATMKG